MNGRTLGLEAISFYQNRISSKKGFRCAHAVYHGGLSCSEFGKRSLSKYGYVKFSVLMAKRFQSCYNAIDEMEKDQRTWTQDDEADNCLWKAWAPLEAGCCILSIFGG